MLVEICTNDLVDALTAQQEGANRIEYCADLRSGGITASHGALLLAARKLTIPFFPIIRPRGGHFVYNGDEYAVMMEDVRYCRSLGCAGVVFGMLTPEGEVDRARTAALVAAAYPMEVTFHRAFDAARDLHEALDTIIQAGCTRVLTSGGKPSAPEGASVIRSLVGAADGQITILPGGGVRPENAAALVAATGVEELHSSLLRGGEGRLEGGEVKRMREALGIKKPAQGAGPVRNG